MAEVQENREECAVPPRPIDWQSRQVWVTSIVIALGLGALGGVSCALADPLLAYRTPLGAELVAGLWSLASALAAFGAAFWMARRWSAKYGGGDPASLILTGGDKASGGQTSYFLMMGLWVLAVFAVGSVVLAVFDLFLAIRSSPGSRALVLGGFGIVGVPLLFWILGEQAQARKAG